MATVKHLIASFGAIRYRIFTGCARGILDLTEGRLATRTVGDNIGGARTMRRFGNLLMTGLVTGVLSTVERTTTQIWAFERTDPLFNSRSIVRCHVVLSALFGFRPVVTKNVFLYLAAVATRWDAYFTDPTRAIVAWSRTTMFSTRHKSSANLTATPALLVIGVYTTSCH